MKFNDYVIAVNDYSVIRLVATKAKNPEHAIVKAIVKLTNEFLENSKEELPIDADLLYEKFIRLNKDLDSDLETIDIKEFIERFLNFNIWFNDLTIMSFLENGKEYVIENID